MLLIIVKISVITLVVGMIVLIIATAYRGKLMSGMDKDVKSAFEAIIALEPALTGRMASELKLSNTVIGEDNFVVEYGNGEFLKLSPNSVSALNVYMQKYRRADLLLKIAVYIFATGTMLFCVSYLLLFILN